MPSIQKINTIENILFENFPLITIIYLIGCENSQTYLIAWPSIRRLSKTKTYNMGKWWSIFRYNPFNMRKSGRFRYCTKFAKEEINFISRKK